MLSNVFMQVLDMSKTASVVIAVVLVARLLLKKAPKWISYALWAVVLLRLLCPFSIEAPVSAVPRMETISTEMVDSTLPRFEFETPADRQYNRHVLDTTPPGESYALVGRSFEPTQWLSIIWLTGIAVMLIYSAVSYIKLRRRLVGAALLRDNIYFADRIDSPFVMGLIRPKIYLPSSIGEREQEYIILHEQRHIRRLDYVIKVLAFAALCLHWFNPLVWLAFILSGKDMEMSCDESVIKTLGSEIRADYSASLLSLATGRRLIARTPLAFGEGDTRGRIKNLAKWKKPVIWIVIIALLLCAVLAVCLLTDPVDKGDTITLTERKNDSNIHIEYDLDIGEAVKSGTIVAEVWANGECVQSAPVTFTRYAKEIDLLLTPRREDDKYSGVDVQITTDQYGGSLLTYFALPEYSGGLGWATMAREKEEDIALEPGTARMLVAVAFDLGNGVHGLDCETLEKEPERLKQYEYIIVIMAGFNAEELAPQQTAEVSSSKEVLQLHHVVKLAEKGHELGWADFEKFDYIETGSGLYIRVYEIDETFSLWIGGSSPQIEMEPMYIYLVANDLNTRIEIRDGGVEEFIAEHGGKPAKLSDEKIAELREIYPADTHGNAIDLEYVLEAAEGLAVVTVTDEIVYHYDMEYLPVWIDEVIYGEGMPERGTAAELWLGNSGLITSDYGHRGVPDGIRYLCFIDLHESHGFSANNAAMAYLTEDGYLMPADAKGAFADYEGWSLEAFLSACGISAEVTIGDSVLERMANLSAEDIEYISSLVEIDPAAMAEAMNSAATNPITRDEGVMGHWNIDVYTGVGDENFRLYAGTERNIIQLYYHTDKSEYTTYYFKDKKLYDLIRSAFRHEGLIETEALWAFEDILAARAEESIRQSELAVGAQPFTGYEITEFYEHDLFKNGDELYTVYKWDVAFIPEDPDKVAWAGGMWLDGELRVRDYDLYTYLVVRSVDGEMVDYRFMFYDIYNGAGDDSERSRAWSEILSAWGET